MLMYAGAPLALGVFRARLPEADRPYRLRALRVALPAERIRQLVDRGAVEPAHP